MNPADDLERAIERLQITTRAETDKHILNDAFAALGRFTQKPSREIGQGFWRMIMASRIAKPAAAAAVILVALALFFNIPTKKTVAMIKIYEALGKVGNICVSEFSAGETIPYREVWTSQMLKVKLFKSGGNNQVQYALWDIPNKVKMITYLSSQAVQTEPITEQMLAELEKSVAEPFEMVPFPDINNIPENAQWKHIDKSAVAVAVPGTEVYDLTWIRKGTRPEEAAFGKWRVFIDIRNYLPKRAELYAKLKPEDEYRLETFTVFAYPGESEIEALIQNTFGSAANRPDEPEYMGTPGAER